MLKKHSVSFFVLTLATLFSTQAHSFGKKRKTITLDEIQTLEITQSNSEDSWSGHIRIKNKNEKDYSLENRGYQNVSLQEKGIKEISGELVLDTRSKLPSDVYKHGVLQFKIDFDGENKPGKLKTKVETKVYFQGKEQKQIQCKNQLNVESDFLGSLKIDLSKLETFLSCDQKDKDRFDPSAVTKNRFITPVETRGFAFLEFPIDPLHVDVSLGQGFRREFNSKNYSMILPQDHPTSRYIENLTYKILSGADRDLKGMNLEVYVVNTDHINAFAVPGGPLYVFRGLIESTASEAELAAVLGHEIAHVTARHYSRKMAALTSEIVQRVIAAYGISALASTKIKKAWVNALIRELLVAYAQVSAVFEVMHQGRNFELEADKYGSQYIYNIGMKPYAIADFFSFLSKRYGDERGSWLEEAMRSHPHHSDRISQAYDLSAYYYPKKSNYLPDSYDFYDAIREMKRYRKPTRFENENVLSVTSNLYQSMTETKLQERVGAMVKLTDDEE